MSDIREIAKKIEIDLLERKIIEKLEYNDKDQREIHLIATPDVLKRELIFIIVSGHPEIAGVWSNTLLSQGKLEESSMEAYFQKFYDEEWGLVALNPHLIDDDLVGTSYIYQINLLLNEIPPETKIGFIGFSMGGRIVYDYLNKYKDRIKKLIAIAQIDPVIQSFDWDKETIEKLNKNTILFASSTDQYRFGIIASAILNLSSIPIEGIHGSLPNKCLNKIIDFFRSQI